MDSFGVPEKINRQIVKAINHYTNDSGSDSKFMKIYEYVKMCNRNLKPVPKMRETVRKALNNLCQSGIVFKSSDSYLMATQLKQTSKKAAKPVAKRNTKSTKKLARSPGPSRQPGQHSKTSRSVPIAERPKKALKRLQSVSGFPSRRGSKTDLFKAKKVAAEDHLTAEHGFSGFSNLQPLSQIEDYSMADPGADDFDSGDEHNRIESNTGRPETYEGNFLDEQMIEEENVEDQSEENSYNGDKSYSESDDEGDYQTEKDIVSEEDTNEGNIADPQPEKSEETTNPERSTLE